MMHRVLKNFAKAENRTCTRQTSEYNTLEVSHAMSRSMAQLVKKLACGDFFDDFCTVCLGAYGSPGGKR